jgi:hypothetical protein
VVEGEKTVNTDVDLVGGSTEQRYGEGAVDVEGLIVNVTRSTFQASYEGDRMCKFLSPVRGGTLGSD